MITKEVKWDLFNDHFQNYKVYGIPKAQLVIADIPYNHGNLIKGFTRGMKITQLVLVPYIAPEIEFVDALGDTERGDNGFGSTGK